MLVNLDFKCAVDPGIELGWEAGIRNHSRRACARRDASRDSASFVVGYNTMPLVLVQREQQPLLRSVSRTNRRFRSWPATVANRPVYD